MSRTWPYKAVYRPEWDAWEILDFRGVSEGQRCPEENIIRLSNEQVLALLEAVAETELINKVLAKRVYQKDLCDRHLDIIDELVRIISECVGGEG